MLPRVGFFLSLIENLVTVIIGVQRWVRQGDHLSPLLFLIVQEYLAQIWQQDNVLSNSTLLVAQRWSHLAFTDNIIFFNDQASMRTFNTVRHILDKFSSFSDLEINREKSFAIFSKRENDGSILGFWTRFLPMHYFGVPITGRSISHKDGEYLIADLQGFLSRCSKQGLSYSGRMQQVQRVFFGKFSYLMSSNFAPKHMIDTI